MLTRACDSLNHLFSPLYCQNSKQFNRNGLLLTSYQNDNIHSFLLLKLSQLNPLYMTHLNVFSFSVCVIRCVFYDLLEINIFYEKR